MPDVLLAQAAVEDLRELPASEQATVARSLQSLRTEGESGELLLHRGSNRDDSIRVIHRGRYRIFYTRDSSEDAVYVLAILAHHQGQRQDAYSIFYDRRSTREPENAGQDPTTGEGDDDTEPRPRADKAPARDVFISYTPDEASDYAKELADALDARGVSVWLDQYELRVGDSLAEKIAEGIASSRYVVAILTPGFLAHPWPKRELELVSAREHAGERVLLPIWHGVSLPTVAEFSPELAERLALDSRREDVDEIAEHLAAVVGSER
jgi:mRNA-degrading endonuclease RelE of RelBE toxin-antitoxin system